MRASSGGHIRITSIIFGESMPTRTHRATADHYAGGNPSTHPETGRTWDHDSPPASAPHGRPRARRAALTLETTKRTACGTTSGTSTGRPCSKGLSNRTYAASARICMVNGYTGDKRPILVARTYATLVTTSLHRWRRRRSNTVRSVESCLCVTCYIPVAMRGDTYAPTDTMWRS